jgi:Ras-related protein Rab-18
VGVDLKVKLVQHRGKTIKLTIWDTAGQERFRTLTSSYYRGAHGIIVVYDITNRASFESVGEWLKEVDIYSTRDAAVKMLVGNKTDRADERTVSTAEARDYSRTHSMLFMECSAKTQNGLQQAFTELIDKMLEQPSLLAPPEGEQGKKADLAEYDEEPKVGCC